MIYTTADERTDQLRHEGVRNALALLKAGEPARALDVLLTSVERQAVVNGIRP